MNCHWCNMEHESDNPHCYAQDLKDEISRLRKTEMYEWTDEPPKNNGYFYYNGPLPNGRGDVLEIVQIVNHPGAGYRMAVVFMPLGLVGKQPLVVFDELEHWKGQWAGPEHGLLTVCPAN